ncbi:MAG: DUF1801 domain-containing protein [Myxococcales bacterium]|nr:DUF1801 domain-containing protein [Myxococcales bacterium]MCB9627914.1 DUF1801 domain-containing protein [Sandaracinaceae bacterium]
MAEKKPDKPVAKKAPAKKAPATKAPAKKAPAKKAPIKTAPTKGPVLLSGGNPQIPKGEGDAPVQAYIAAMPGWKQDVGRRLDMLISAAVPNVVKAVKWNTPFYGVRGQGWFLGYHCLTKYVKVSFFRGTSLTPLPPGTSKQAEVRYLDVYDDDAFDEVQFTKWVEQAASLPGTKL